MNIVIVGLRRSGTTAFWDMWRQDARFACYNEPFNPMLSHIHDPRWREGGRSAREFRSLYKSDPARFWETFSPVGRHEELQEALSDKQRHYLEWIQGMNNHTCIDVTRCHFKLKSLYETDPDVFLVHLYRPPANWVTSVVQPSTGHLQYHADWRTRLLRTAQIGVRNYRFRRNFWRARHGHRFKGFDELIGRHPGSFFGIRLREAGLDPEEVYAMPDVGRLLAFWKIHFDHVEREGARLFGGRFISVNFHEFCGDPSRCLREIYVQAGLEPVTFDVRGIRRPPAAYDAGNPQWAAYTERLGLPALG